jgi:hypothetical protein
LVRRRHVTLEEAIEKIKKAYAQKLTGVRASTELLRNAVNVYESAAQEDALNHFLIGSGIISPDTERKAETAALTLLDVVEKLPELRPGYEHEMILLEDEEETEAAPEPLPERPFPLLAADGRPVLIFGGFVVEDKMRSLTQTAGVAVEWISNERNGQGDGECESACRKIRNGQYAGVILLNELMSHRQGDNLIKAAKGAGVHHAVGKKGGKGVLLRALELFEKQRKETVK